MATVDLGNIDTDLLTAQRASLRFVLDEHHYHGDVVQEHLEGINNLLDHIYDQLVPLETGGE